MQVTDRRVAGQRVGSEHPGRLQAGGSADELVEQVVEAGAGGTFGQEREQHIATVVVGEAGARLVGHRPVGQQHERGGRAVQGVERLAHHVVGDRALLGLVEVVADAGAVTEEVLDRDPVVDQREVAAQQRPCRCTERELAAVDEHHGDQCCEALQPARCSEPGVTRVRDTVGAVGEAVYRFVDQPPADVDADHAGESGSLRLLRRGVEQRGEVVGHAHGSVEGLAGASGCGPWTVRRPCGRIGDVGRGAPAALRPRARAVRA